MTRKKQQHTTLSLFIYIKNRNRSMTQPLSYEEKKIGK